MNAGCWTQLFLTLLETCRRACIHLGLPCRTAAYKRIIEVVVNAGSSGNRNDRLDQLEYQLGDGGLCK